jgi:hypothetical protein
VLIRKFLNTKEKGGGEIGKNAHILHTLVATSIEALGKSRMVSIGPSSSFFK